MKENNNDRSSVQIIVQVCKQLLRDPDATLAQKIEVMKILERNYKTRVSNPGGNPQNLKNKKKKKELDNNLLG